MGVKFEIENVVAVGSTVENPNIADTAIERQEPYVRSTIDEENATIHTNIVAPARLGGTWCLPPKIWALTPTKRLTSDYRRMRSLKTPRKIV